MLLIKKPQVRAKPLCASSLMSLTQSISLYCSYIELLLGNLQLYTGPYFKLVRKKKKNTSLSDFCYYTVCFSVKVVSTKRIHLTYPFKMRMLIVCPGYNNIWFFSTVCWYWSTIHHLLILSYREPIHRLESSASQEVQY